MKLLSAFVAFFLAVFAVAIPSPSSVYYPQLSKRNTPCTDAKPQLPLPQDQKNLTAPSPDAVVSFVLLGVGYQNYTCSSDQKHVPAGALAQLFDLSCISVKDPSFFDTIHNDSFELFSKMKNLDTYAIFAARKFGDHFFQSNGNGGIVPVWDFRAGATPNQTNAFVIGSKVGGLSAPDKADVDWLQLTGNGDLATDIYRIHTKGGQPPDGPCNGSEVIRIKYVSEYWLFGSKITVS